MRRLFTRPLLLLLRPGCGLFLGLPGPLAAGRFGAGGGARVGGGGRGSARGVRGSPRLELAHEGGAHVGRLGVDAAADTREEGLRRSAHAEGQHRRRDDDELLRPGHVGETVQNQILERNAEQSEAHYHEAHDGAAAEGDL